MSDGSLSDGRIWFFLVAAVVAGLMTPLAPGAFRWVAEATCATYLVLAVLVTLDVLSRRSSDRQHDP